MPKQIIFKAIAAQIGFICFFATLGLAETPAPQPTEAWQVYLQRVIGPLLRSAGREGYARIARSPIEGGNRIRISSGPNPKTPGTLIFANYNIDVVNEEMPPTFLAPALSSQPHPTVRGSTQVTGNLRISASWLNDPATIPILAGQLRSLFRADPFLHEQQLPSDNASPRMSGPQQVVLNQLAHFHKVAREKGEMTRALVFMPTGTGKTEILGEHIKRSNEEGANYQVIFVVQNNRILQEVSHRLPKILGLNPLTDVQRIYGQGSSSEVFDSRKKIVFINRTQLHNQLGIFLMGIRATPNTRRIYALDETQGAGKEEGEYAQILSEVEQLARANDQLIGLSATPWHTEADLVQLHYRGNVASSFLSPSEIRDFVAGNSVVRYARLILFRAIAQGYLSPIFSLNQVHFDDPERILTVNQILDDVDETKIDQRRQEIERNIQIHVPLLQKMITDIKSTLEVTAEDRPVNLELGAPAGFIPNYGIIYVPSIAHANVYATMLNMMARKSRMRIDFYPYHSALPKDGEGSQGDTISKFTDMSAGRDGIRPHKYLVAVRAISEGFDFRPLNHILIAKRYSDNDLVSARALLQQIGRGTRTSIGKSRFFVTDMSGALAPLLLGDIDPDLARRIIVGSHDSTPTDRPIRRGGVFLDYSTVPLERLSTQVIDTTTPIEEAARNPESDVEAEDEDGEGENAAGASRPERIDNRKPQVQHSRGTSEYFYQRNLEDMEYRDSVVKRLSPSQPLDDDQHTPRLRSSTLSASAAMLLGQSHPWHSALRSLTVLQPNMPGFDVLHGQTLQDFLEGFSSYDKWAEFVALLTARIMAEHRRDLIANLSPVMRLEVVDTVLRRHLAREFLYPSIFSNPQTRVERRRRWIANERTPLSELTYDEILARPIEDVPKSNYLPPMRSDGYRRDEERSRPLDLESAGLTAGTTYRPWLKAPDRSLLLESLLEVHWHALADQRNRIGKPGEDASSLYEDYENRRSRGRYELFTVKELREMLSEFYDSRFQLTPIFRMDAFIMSIPNALRDLWGKTIPASDIAGYLRAPVGRITYAQDRLFPKGDTPQTRIEMLDRIYFFDTGLLVRPTQENLLRNESPRLGHSTSSRFEQRAHMLGSLARILGLQHDFLGRRAANLDEVIAILEANPAPPSCETELTKQEGPRRRGGGLLYY